uniref:NADH dehydrogenase subunit 2 n=1 Tax=Lamproglena chinensis TaxID=342427 RepID=UPI00286AB216|nr:NADH dehydrogenase subunit 2 [Lamproglena chinensis]WKF18930.1 NADH dehydrogenase subunit 2 [Lamproglena chinensis]
MSWKSCLYWAFLITSIFMSLSSSSWITLWAALELNLVSFIGVMMSSVSPEIKFSHTRSNMLIYFLTQAATSLALLVVILLLSHYMLEMMFTMAGLMLLIKLGSFPFHMWYTNILEHLSWHNIWAISTVQKIIPLYYLTLLNTPYILFLAIAGNAALSIQTGMNQLSMKKIMLVSSLFQSSWLIMLCFSSPQSALVYLGFYSLYIYMFVSMILGPNTTFKPLANIPDMQATPAVFSMLMVLGGLPPMFSFFIKIQALGTMLPMFTAIATILMIMAMAMFYIYIKMFLYFLLFSSNMAPLKSLAHAVPHPILLVLALITPLVMIPYM